jgi:hypothetical protein
MNNSGGKYNICLQVTCKVPVRLHGITSQKTIILIFTTLGPHISYSFYLNRKEVLFEPGVRIKIPHSVYSAGICGWCRGHN